MVGRARMFSSPSLSPLVEGSSTGLGALWREDPFAKVKAAREAAQLQAMEIPVMRAFIRPRPEQENIPRELLLANGRTPAQVSTNASDTSRVYVHLDSRELSLQRLAAGGVHYLYSRVFKLEVYATPPSATRPEAQLEARPLEVVHVLPRVISVDSVKGNIVDVRFCRLHHDTKLKVKVPVRVDGTDVSPGLRRGGWLNTVQKTLECSTLGIKIPPFLSANVARLEIGDKIFFQDLNVPQGIRVRMKDPSLPVVMISGKGRKAGAA